MVNCIQIINPSAFQHYFRLNIKKVLKSIVLLKFKRLRQLVAYADGVNLLSDNIGTIKRNRNCN
jgi:hypothetical protein